MIRIKRGGKVDAQKSNLHIYIEKTNVFTIKESKAIIVTLKEL